MADANRKMNDRLREQTRDYEKLSNEHHKTLEYCNELESYYAKLKSRLGISINLDNIKRA